MKRLIAALLSLLLAFSIFGSLSGLADGKIFGDVDGDKEITATDALYILQYAVGMRQFTDEQKDLAKVTTEDGSGNVEVSDALAVLQFSVKLRTEFVRKEVSNHIEIPETIVENNAYVKDASADTSFMIDETGLTPKTIYVIGFKGDAHENRLIASLQGLINRAFGMDDDHTVLVNFALDGSDKFWMSEMTSKGVFTQLNSKKKIVSSMDAFYETFANQLKYCGMVTWDGGVPATSNVAATICGVDGYLPVLKGSSIETKLPEWALKKNIPFQQIHR